MNYRRQDLYNWYQRLLSSLPTLQRLINRGETALETWLDIKILTAMEQLRALQDYPQTPGALSPDQIESWFWKVTRRIRQKKIAYDVYRVVHLYIFCRNWLTVSSHIQLTLH